VLLGDREARGLGAIAVTDHNEISARSRPRRSRRPSSIVAEEVKTADQARSSASSSERRSPEA